MRWQRTRRRGGGILFFSSRRRHTRYWRDWSSDVCSSDLEAIGILNGSLPASGPGVRLTIQDPEGAVPPSVVLDAIQELRGAGAEAIEVDGVRVVVSSAVTGTPGALRIDGVPLDDPYEFLVVGPPAAMEVALNVSGGVVADVGRVGGTATVRQVDDVTVQATVG